MVRDYNLLRAAIDANPNLFSARASMDYMAIMVELNRHLPIGQMVTVMDVKQAMGLRPVDALGETVAAIGRANGRGGLE